MNERISTVRGAIDPGELGFCQPHEHLFIAPGPARETFPALVIDDAEKSLIDAVLFRRAGGGAIVDAQPVFAGRNAKALKQISEESGIHIIASTGFHKPFFYEEKNRLFDLKAEELADIFSKEIEEGMYAEAYYTDNPTHTDIRAGQIKTALEKDFTEVYQKLFKAAASASVRTGAPVMIHVDKDADPLMLLKYLEDQGVGANRQIYCHIDRAVGNTSVHKELARAGAYLEYDTIARPKYHSDKYELELITDILNAGFSDRLLLSLDTTRERLIGYAGSVGLDYILKSFIPELKKRGIDDEIFKMIFVDNTAAVFTGRRKK